MSETSTIESLKSEVIGLKSEVNRLNRELAQTSSQKIQSAQCGLVLLAEKEDLQRRYDELEASYETTKKDLEDLRHAFNKSQTIQKVSATSGLEQEELLLRESAHKEACFATTLQELERELKQVRYELGRVRAERERYGLDFAEQTKQMELLEWQRKSLRMQLKELKFRESRLLTDNNELEEENISLQEQVASLKCSQIDFETSKHEVRRLQEVVEALEAQLEEFGHLKRIAERQVRLYSQIQLPESEKSEDDFVINCDNERKAFTEEENNKYKIIEELHKVYIECAAQQNEIIELKQQVNALKREIADRDNELWFYKSRSPENLFHNSIDRSERNLDKSIRESILISRTSSEIPEYSFSVNEDDSDHIYRDFNDEISSKHSFDESFNSFNSLENSEDIVVKDNSYLFKMFNGLIGYLLYFIVKLPFRVIIATILMIISAKILLVSLFPTHLPPYTSWEEIIYRILLPYITKVKVSKTQ